MPKPKKKEKRKDFIKRCIPYIMKEEGIKKEHAVGKCYGIFKSNKGKK